MNAIRIFVAGLLVAFLFSPSIVMSFESPETYHLNFDDLSFLEDCYVAQSKLKTAEERKLETVEGRFGGALYLGAVPLIMDENNMSGLDLDLVTAVIYNVAMAGRKGTGYDEPFIWGAGKLHPAYGSLAFWVKGPKREGVLFNQSASSFGRMEKELMEVKLEKDGSLSAYVEDARYVRHSIKTKPLWRDDAWMHVVLQWDRSSGLSIWVNGKEAASSMGTDAWWENQRPGLFHFPMARAAYDEFRIFDRPLSETEIAALYRKNEAPKGSKAIVSSTDGSAARLKNAWSSDFSALPVLISSSIGALTFRQVTPEKIHDESIPGWWLADGRYECAWPHEYAIFTIIIGDSDYHAEKADFVLPEGDTVNYVTFEGNLDGVDLFSARNGSEFSANPVASAPRDDGFFFGTAVDCADADALRIPFVKSWGTPPGFEGEGVNLPVTGDLRIHEVGLFNVEETRTQLLPGDRSLYIHNVPPVLTDKRYPTALQALFPSTDRSLAGMYANPVGNGAGSIEIAPMSSLHLMSEPHVNDGPVSECLIDAWVESPTEGNVVSVRLFNPATPSQIWTHAEAKLEGFGDDAGRLRLRLVFDPLYLSSGDRLWLQLIPTEGLTILTGDSERPSTVSFRPAMDRISAANNYAIRTMAPGAMTYSKMFEYMPWRITGRFPDLDVPENFGGPFDMVYSWQAALKADPGNRLANIYRELVSNRYDSNSYPPKERVFPAKQYAPPQNAPDWALHFRDYKSARERIITWWRQNQRSDGQAGGGWNDDTLLFSSDHGREGGFSDMMLDCSPDALTLYNNVFEGFERSGLFKGGYCRITPMDRLHNGDFIRERYKSLIYNLGDPQSARWACEEAWHWEKPDETPVNYGDGSAFLFGKNVLEWYWGMKRVEKPYVLENRDELKAALKTASEAYNDTVLWRFTEARVHTDDMSPHGSGIMHTLVNGSFGEREQGAGVYYTHLAITLGLGWIEGGGADLARMVEYSGNDGFKVSMYSFDALERMATVRLYRLDAGEYAVKVSTDSDGDGVYEQASYEKTARLDRFGRLSFPIPPQIRSRVEVSQLSRDPLPGELPDLAINARDIVRDRNSLEITVHNLGNAASGPFTVSAFDGKGTELQSVRVESLDSPSDFLPRMATVKLDTIPQNDSISIKVGIDNGGREIFTENNAVNVE